MLLHFAFPCSSPECFMSLVHLLVEPKTLKDALERLSRRGFEPSSSTPVASDRAVDACNLRFLRRHLNSGPLRQTLLEPRKSWCCCGASISAVMPGFPTRLCACFQGRQSHLREASDRQVSGGSPSGKWNLCWSGISGLIVSQNFAHDQIVDL